MTKKEITVLSWDQAEAKFPKNHSNQGIFDGLNQINSSLTAEEQFVYHAKYEFGEKIIHKGRLHLDDYEVAANKYRRSIDDFKKDVGYSNDPLAIILTNYVEVYTENTCDRDSYPVPLNIIREGDIFGVFGTLDILANCPNSDNLKERDWYVVAGNISFHIAFPFGNQTELELLSSELQPFFAESENTYTTRGNHKVKFIKEHVSNWFVEVIYIPRHYLQKLKSLDMIFFENLLFKKGWHQSSPLRYALFEDTTISDLLSATPKKYLTHEKIFLSKVYLYLTQCFFKNAIIYKPLLSEDHVINKAIVEFKDRNQKYFQKSKCVEPLPFISGFLDEGGWGLLSYYHLPIIYNYKPESLTDLIKDLASLRSKIQGNQVIANKQRYILPKIYAFGNRGSTSNSLIQDSKEIKDFIAKTFNKAEEQVNLTSKDFTNIILIKSEHDIS